MNNKREQFEPRNGCSCKHHTLLCYSFKVLKVQFKFSIKIHHILFKGSVFILPVLCSCGPRPDQPYSSSWTDESSSHQSSICLSLLHCSALPTGCGIYTFFFSAHSSHPCHAAACLFFFSACNTASTACTEGMSAVGLAGNEGNHRASRASVYTKRAHYTLILWTYKVCLSN